jgi:3-deoxy-D-manno-octulosonic-acid transferase
MSLLRSGYYGVSWIGTPLVSGYLAWRASRGREEKPRLKERKGVATAARPAKSLVWIHAVSVGEALAALTIMQAILKKYPNIHGLLTTTTVSSAKVIQKRLYKIKKITHQYCPVDTPLAVGRFLNHWQPDLAIWIESELWPNLLHTTQERGIPTILLNGRMSPKSFAFWKYIRGMLRPMLERLSLCAVQSEEQARFFKELGATTVTVMGNAKVMMSPLGVDAKKYAALKKELGGRPVWFAASTHPGEEVLVFEAHKTLKKDYPDLLTILVPRHIERAPALCELAAQEGIKAVLRTDSPSLKECELYIGNTLGEMGLFYALSPVVMMGATFVPKGGHNPIEAAQLGAFVLHGSHVFNNPQLYEILESLGGSEGLAEGKTLASRIRPWLGKPKDEYEELQGLTAYRQEGLEKLLTLLTPYLKTLREDPL